MKIQVVLIDTQWNVNVKYDTAKEALDAVLIDTQWNVNGEADERTCYSVGFNRYIVECKF